MWFTRGYEHAVISTTRGYVITASGTLPQVNAAEHSTEAGLQYTS